MGGFTSIHIEGDAKNIIADLLSLSPSLSFYGHIIDDAKRLFLLLERFSVSFVKRSTNQAEAAHILAFVAIDVSGAWYWMEDAPHHCYRVLISDCNFPCISLAV